MFFIVKRTAHPDLHPSIKQFGALLVLSAVLFTAGCLSGNVSDPSGELVLAEDAPNTLFEVFFTEPENPASKTLRGGPDKALADAIRLARVQVDIAAYQLNLWSIRDALLDAHQRGVRVRMVTESDYIDEAEVQELLAAGLPVLGDRREGLMHNKFVVIDRQDVWLGSMNFTVNGAYKNDNNLALIHSPKLAENYSTEFDEMFVEDRFGSGSPANTPHPNFVESGAVIETFFSPEDRTATRIFELIRQAEESVYFLAYSFTSDELASALIERFRAGIHVQGVFDQSQYKSNTGGEFDRLRAEGLDVRLDGAQRKMHHKVIVIDESIVITGSYNFSKSAETRNDENIIIFHHPEFAAIYLSEFKTILARAKP